MFKRLSLSALVLPLLCMACIVVPHSEPWAPLAISLEPGLVHASSDTFVTVDGDYRGNLVDGVFRLYLTAGEHDIRVDVPGHQPWERRIVFSVPRSSPYADQPLVVSGLVRD